MHSVRVLNVAEKNDAAKEISRIMSRGSCRKREGRSKYNKIYEFPFLLLGNNCQMAMTSVSGHLMNKEFSAGYKKWASCSPLALFTAKVENYCPEDYLPIKATLEQEAAVSSVLVLWTDGDREGEAIAHEIMEVCCCVNSRLEVYRARFSEITPQSIYRACQHLGAIDQNVADAVDVRQELDLRIGAAFTRFQTLYLKKKFPDALSESLISYGSCQFPTLGFVTERFKQIEDFVPESFHKITVTYETDNDVVVFRWKRIRVFRKLACQILYDMCMENPTARVLTINSRHKSKWRPQALDTVELEKLASRKLHINAKETMRIAEKLYTRGFISYPRTETNIFPSTMDLNSIIQEQTQDQHWGGFAAGILAQGGATPRNGSKTDNAHPPIHPTKHASHLQGNEQQIYELVTRHFLACCSKDAQGQETTVEIEIARERFTAQGLMITARNYLEVYPYDRWSDKTIPVFQQEQTFQPTRLEMVEGETTAPSPLQEADLISLMEKHGIGTDATHADHIETIKQREYVGCTTEGSFLPAQLGLGLVNGYDAMGFQMSKPYLRAELEADLRRICNGEKRKEDVLAVHVEKYRDVFIKACEQAHLLDEALLEFFGEPADVPQEEATPSMEDIVVRHCPSCTNADMLLHVSKEGRYFIGCAGYPLCRACAFFPRSVTSVTVTKDVCTRCRPPPVFKVRLKCKRGTFPPHVMQQDDGSYLVCVGGCDQGIIDALDLRLRTKSVDSSFTSGCTRQSSAQLSQQLPYRSLHQPSNQPFPLQNADSGVGFNNSDSQPQWQHIRTHNNGSGHAMTHGHDFHRASHLSRMGSQRNGSLMGSNPSSCISGSLSQSPSLQTLNGHCVQGAVTTSSGNSVVCKCGLSAARRTTHKPGPNQGRDFFCCLNNKCNFFLWTDSEQNQQQSVAKETLHVPQTSPDSTEDGGVPECTCGGAAARKTTQKTGPNQGRDFFCCQNRCCDFFKWADVEWNATNSAGSSGSGSHARSTVDQYPVYHAHQQVDLMSQGPYNDEGAGSSSRHTVVCNCGQSAIRRTTHKPGPNEGREFFCCQINSCNFFMWSDSEQSLSNSRSYGVYNGDSGVLNSASQLPQQPPQSTTWMPHDQSSAGSGDGQRAVMCQCGQSAARRTTRKQGPNQGRDFFCCSKPQETRCDFFMWADVEQDDTHAVVSSSWCDSKRKKGRRFHQGEGDRWSGGPQTVRKRKCGNCHQLGHDRRTCPHLNCN